MSNPFDDPNILAYRNMMPAQAQPMPRRGLTLEEQLAQAGAQADRDVLAMRGGPPPAAAPAGPPVAAFDSYTEVPAAPPEAAAVYGGVPTAAYGMGDSFNPNDSMAGPRSAPALRGGPSDAELMAGFEQARMDPQNLEQTLHAGLNQRMDEASAQREALGNQAAFGFQDQQNQIGTRMAMAANQPAPSHQSNADFMNAGMADAYGGEQKIDFEDYNQTVSPYDESKAPGQRPTGLMTNDEKEAEAKRRSDAYAKLLDKAMTGPQQASTYKNFGTPRY